MQIDKTCIAGQALERIVPAIYMLPKTQQDRLLLSLSAVKQHDCSIDILLIKNLADDFLFSLLRLLIMVWVLAEKCSDHSYPVLL